MIRPANHHPQGLILAGLDGSNPLAFLAALGTLRLLATHRPAAAPKVAWLVSHGKWCPSISLPQPIDEEELLESLEAALAQAWLVHQRLADLGDDLSIPPTRFRDVARQNVPASPLERSVADFLAAFGCDALANDKGDVIQDTAFRTMAGAGHQHFLGFMRNIAEATTREHIRKALFTEWQYDDPVEKLTMRWDPQDDTRYALQWRNPSGNPIRKKAGNMLGANRLAIEGLPLFPTIPLARQLATTGFRGQRARDTFWTWPIWIHPISIDVVRSLLSLKELQHDSIDRATRRLLHEYGIPEVFRVQRLTVGKVRNFSPSVAL